MNEELDEAAVSAAVAGYARTGRDLADGYLLAALTIRAMYDGDDPEIGRALRLYGDAERLIHLESALMELAAHIGAERDHRRGLGADDIRPATLPGELTQEIRVPADLRSVKAQVAERTPHEYRAPWSDDSDRCVRPARPADLRSEDCGLPYAHPVHVLAGDTSTKALPAVSP